MVFRPLSKFNDHWKGETHPIAGFPGAIDLDVRRPILRELEDLSIDADLRVFAPAWKTQIEGEVYSALRIDVKLNLFAERIIRLLLNRDFRAVAGNCIYFRGRVKRRT